MVLRNRASAAAVGGRNMGLLEGRHAVVWGVANRRSIAWGIARALAREGAKLALTYQGERMERMVRECADQIPGTLMLPADVTDQHQIDEVYSRLGEAWGRVDVVVHSIAFAPAEDLQGRFLDTSRDGFRQALDISAYSLVAITRAAVPLMTDGGSVMALTYLASERVFPSYNVMGVAKAALEATVRYLAVDVAKSRITVNAISPGPVSTLAARGIKGFTSFAKTHAERAPMGRATELDEIGDTAVFLASNWSRGITGEVIYVDQGYHLVGA
jgi:enoyl-[acyl-carrier protein] reductase I